MRQILWSPEKGECSCCGSRNSCIRRFTSENIHFMYCVVCWNHVQDDVEFSSGDWSSSEAVIFEIDGNPQESWVWN
jgi:hypothetical protein